MPRCFFAVWPWGIGVLAMVVMGGLAGSRPVAAETPVKIDFGEPAPQWLREAESYALYGNEEGHITSADWDALAQSKVTFITHCPISREFFARCHALGIRGLPYVTFSNAWTSMTCQDLNLRDRPAFIAVDEKGNFQRTPFWDSEDSKNRYNVCPNVAAYQDAMVAWVEKIMKLGADGVFVDNVSTRARLCYGPKFGKHKHVYTNQDHAYAVLLKRVREAVKRYRPDGAVVINSGMPLSLPAEYFKYVDADMLESYICTWVSKDRQRSSWEKHWHEQGVQLRPFINAGKQVQALSYLGHTPYGIKEDAFFCYATARLAGFVWNGGLPMSEPETAPLHRLRLGKPLHDEVKQNGVYWRAFEAGLVAVNPDQDQAGFVAVKPPIPATRFCDVFAVGTAGEIVDVAKDKKLRVPAYSGRVFLYEWSGTRDLTFEKPGVRLTVVTKPGLGEVCFRVDGCNYWTHCGRWTTKYELGPKFGSFSVKFDKPGRHVVEVVDVVPADMKTPAGYASGKRLGESMDPSNPTKPSNGRKFRFRGWSGAVTSGEPRIEVDVSHDTRVVAEFSVQ